MAAAAAVEAPSITPDALLDTASAAISAWQANPADATLKTAAEKAVTEAKAAAVAAKTALAATAAPEKYTLALPKDSRLPAEQVAQVEAFAKANKLTNAQAQAILESQNATAANLENAQKAQLEQAQAAWLKASMDDPDIGGDKLKATAENCRRLIDKFLPAGNPDGDKFREDLKTTGLGNYTPLMKFLNNIYKSMGEDQLVLSTAAPAAATASAASIILPNSTAQALKP
jgi:hypothetical protein